MKLSELLEYARDTKREYDNKEISRDDLGLKVAGIHSGFMGLRWQVRTDKYSKEVKELRDIYIYLAKEAGDELTSPQYL